MNTNRSDVVSASEIASYEWCPESWRLDAIGKESGNKEELADGEAFHRRIATTETSSRTATNFGWLLFASGLLLAAISLLLKAVGR